MTLDFVKLELSDVKLVSSLVIKATWVTKEWDESRLKVTLKLILNFLLKNSAWEKEATGNPWVMELRVLLNGSLRLGEPKNEMLQKKRACLLSSSVVEQLLRECEAFVRRVKRPLGSASGATEV